MISIGFIGGAYQSAVGYTHFIASQMDNKWSGVKCSFKADISTYKGNSGTWWERERTNTVYFCTPEDHNVEKMIYGLNYREMWLVKRKEN